MYRMHWQIFTAVFYDIVGISLLAVYNLTFRRDHKISSHNLCLPVSSLGGLGFRDAC